MTERSYGDSCALARSLDVIGDRWALLVVRELLLGPKRFRDLRADLPKISQNVLSQRLDDLEEAGVLRRIVLDPPANAPAYELTQRGLDLRPALIALARWGALAPTPDGAEQGPAAFLLTLDALFDPSRLSGPPITGTLVMARERFTLIATADGLRQQRGESPDSDFRADGTVPALRALLIRGDQSDSELNFAGNRDALERFRACLTVPVPVGAARADLSRPE